jgi:DNA-binding response OmpR family regulator
VVTDIILPRGNGLSLLKFAKEASSHRQVILITDAPSIETASEVVRLGASDYLVKPIGKEQFLLSQAKAVDARGLTPEREVEDTTSEFNPKQLENLLQKSENRLKEVQKMAQLGSWEWNLRQNIVLWSDEMYSIYGFPKGSPPNRGAIRELVVPEDRNIFDGAFQNRTKGEV